MKYLEERFGIEIPPKRIINAALVLAMMAFMAIVIFSGQLKGRYVSQDLIPQTFTFGDDNQVTMSAFNIIDVHGTYKIKDGQIEVKYQLLGQDCIWTQSFSQKGRRIYVGGTEFKKQSMLDDIIAVFERNKNRRRRK